MMYAGSCSSCIMFTSWPCSILLFLNHAHAGTRHESQDGMSHHESTLAGTSILTACNLMADPVALLEVAACQEHSLSMVVHVGHSLP